MSKITEFLFGINDWKLVWSDTGSFIRTGVITGSQTTELAIYKIYFSFSRNRYRLKLGGFHPKENSMYKVAIDKLNHFESQL